MEEPATLVSKWLRAAGKQTGVDLSLDEDGHCRLLIDDGEQCIVEVPRGSEHVFLYSAIARVPEHPPHAMRTMRLALAMNAFGIETSGSAFSYDARSEHIVLTFSTRLDALDESIFCAVLGSFIEVGIRAKAKFEQQLEQGNDIASAQLPISMLAFSTRA